MFAAFIGSSFYFIFFVLMLIWKSFCFVYSFWFWFLSVWILRSLCLTLLSTHKIFFDTYNNQNIPKLFRPCHFYSFFFFFWCLKLLDSLALQDIFVLKTKNVIVTTTRMHECVCMHDCVSQCVCECVYVHVFAAIILLRFRIWVCSLGNSLFHIFRCCGCRRRRRFRSFLASLILTLHCVLLFIRAHSPLLSYTLSF